jgi:hypothetical protein
MPRPPSLATMAALSRLCKWHLADYKRFVSAQQVADAMGEPKNVITQHLSRFIRLGYAVRTRPAVYSIKRKAKHIPATYQPTLEGREWLKEGHRGS